MSSKRDREHIVEDERDALRRRQALEDDEEREADRIRRERLLLGIARGVVAQDRFRRPWHVRVGPGATSAQHV